jgi:hypothetical protein
MKFKTEICLLLFAITLFAVSMIFYSYQNAINDQTALDLTAASYPYRGYALSFVGMASVLTATASISYSKRSKNLLK